MIQLHFGKERVQNIPSCRRRAIVKNNFELEDDRDCRLVGHFLSEQLKPEWIHSSYFHGIEKGEIRPFLKNENLCFFKKLRKNWKTFFLYWSLMANILFIKCVEVERYYFFLSRNRCVKKIGLVHKIFVSLHHCIS